MVERGDHSYIELVIRSADDSPVQGSGDVLARLTRRERQVLDMAARGLTNPQIAKALDLTVHAVKFHLGAVYRKLDVSNRTEAAVLYLHLELEQSNSSKDAVA
jgi:DNA-binding NarL/FixJ family response regulator